MATYAIVEGVDEVRVTLAGVAGFAEMLVLIDELEALGQLRILLDETDYESGTLTSSDIRLLVDAWQRAPVLRGARVAIVAPDPLNFGIARIAHGVGGERVEDQLGIFRTESEALAWLHR
jgi:hypothetical protein